MIYTSTAYIDNTTGNVVASPTGSDTWSDKTTWASMLWQTSYANPMIYYTEPVELPNKLGYYNLGIDSSANGTITYHVIESSTSTFMTVYDRDPLGVTVNGSVTTNTSTVKFGSTSLQFPGTTSSYATIDSTVMATGTGSWTIEFWAYALDNSKDYQAIVCNDSAGDQLMGIYWALGGIKTTLKQNSAFTGVSLSTSTWYHIAVAYDGPTLTSRTFINGNCAIVDNVANTGTNITSTNLQIGKGKGYITNYLTGSPVENPFYGYIDDLRISNTCRYTGNLFDQVFTPPTATLTNDTATTFLCTGERGIVDTPNIIEEVIETVINDGDTNIPAFSRKYVMVGIEVDSSERGRIYSSKITPNQKRIDILLTDVDVTTLTNSTTTSTSKVLDLGRETSRILAVFPQKSAGLTDVGLIPVVANKTEPAISFVKATEGSQDYVYGGAAGAAVDPTTLTDPTIDVIVHALPEQYMANGRLQSR